MSEEKRGWSIILLAIVIFTMSIALYLVSSLFYNKGTDKAQEEAFKLNVYEYRLEIEDYKAQMKYTQGYDEASFNVYGVDLQKIIPDIVETDMSKFKIEQGKLIYIGNDEQEKTWSKEVRI